jgi:hypothetical protein
MNNTLKPSAFQCATRSLGRNLHSARAVTDAHAVCARQPRAPADVVLNVRNLDVAAHKQPTREVRVLQGVRLYHVVCPARARQHVSNSHNNTNMLMHTHTHIHERTNTGTHKKAHTHARASHTHTHTHTHAHQSRFPHLSNASLNIASRPLGAAAPLPRGSTDASGLMLLAPVMHVQTHTDNAAARGAKHTWTSRSASSDTEPCLS